MPINFPNSPSPSQLYTYDNKTWEWNGIYWEVYSGLTSYVSGAGTTNYVPKWTGSTGLGDSIIYDDGTFVGVGNGGASPTHTSTKLIVGGPLEVGGEGLQIVGRGNSVGITDRNLQSWSTGGNEIAIGNGGPLAGSQGNDNIAIGYGSLQTNDSGINNIAIGTY